MTEYGSKNAHPPGQTPRLRLAKVEALVLRAPVETPVQTSFGIMHDRPAVLVRIEDRDGMVGWGEIWCNFPSVGAEHRARVLESCIAPILLEQEWDSPLQAFDTLSEVGAVDVVAITNEKAWCFLVRERVDDLLSGPFGVGICGDVEVDDLSPVMTHHDEDVQNAERDRGHGEEVTGSDIGWCRPGIRTPTH